MTTIPKLGKPLSNKFLTQYSSIAVEHCRVRRPAGERVSVNVILNFCLLLGAKL